MILTYVTFSISQTPVYVNTHVGNIMGFQEYLSIDGDQKLISKFLGIPFAESTGGTNRFKKPIPKAPFKDTFDARKVPMACYQQSDKTNHVYEDVYGVPGFSEDCLTLNIYVPNELRGNELRPVMIWVYGGGFSQGASSLYNPEALALFGNVIVVTINYRIGMFGFLRDINGAFPGNQGLWDQHLAFKWVHDHIDSFYGYKDEITIFGQSAGGASVIFQALYPGNKGLFKRVIAESGSAITPLATQNVSNFVSYLNRQGCDANSKTFVACLQSKTPLELQSNITNFGPVIDGEFVVDSPIDIVNGNSTKTAKARDFFASLDIIVGANNLDGAAFFSVYKILLNHTTLEFNISKDEFRNTVVPVTLSQNSLHVENDIKAALEDVLAFFYTNWKDQDDYVTMRQRVLDMSSDVAFFVPASRTVNTHARLNVGKTYLYEFAVETRNHFVPVPSWMKGKFTID